MRVLYGLVAVVALLCVFYVDKSHQDSIYITGIARDFWPCRAAAGSLACGSNGNVTGCSEYRCHPDFEPVNEVAESGIVTATIGARRKPVFDESTTKKTVTNATTFNYWFADKTGFSWGRTLNLSLNNQDCTGQGECNPTIYGYSEQHFFPLNMQGLGDYIPGTNNHFTYEVHLRFVYRKGMNLKFTGNDDIFVYINDKLVIDMGGVHKQTTTQVNIDQLGLTVGQNYPMDWFIVQRDSVYGSTVLVVTSMELYCVRDHCGVCGGDGSFCCTCNDNNVCTTDSCLANGTCIFTPKVDCSHLATNKCVNAQCNPTTGACTASELNCNDNNPCTTDSCSATLGCANVAVTCDDDDACTTDSCSPTEGCVFTPITCASDNCHNATCDRTLGCQRFAVNCDDNMACTADSCTESSGCVHTAIPNCTDWCIGKVCTSSGNACRPNKCNPVDGSCVITPVVCDDGNGCTDDVCVETKTKEASCQYTLKTCDQTDLCNPQVCQQGQCVPQAVTCDDGNACTTDSCNGTCLHTLVNCDDGDVCTADSCDSRTGCKNTPTGCDDYDLCTNDVCDSQTGNCTHVPIVLPNAGLCVTSFCDPGLGVVSSPVVCRPADKCSCDPELGCVCKGSFWDKFTPVQKGITGGVVAAIVIASAVGVAALAFGGKKGYDYFQTQNRVINSINDNPLYEQSAANRENPLFERAGDSAL